MPNTKTQFHNWVFFITVIFIFIFTSTPSFSDDEKFLQASLFCGTSTPPPNTTLIPQFIAEMQQLSELVTNNSWGKHYVNATPPIYGFAQCYGDLSHTDCLLCYGIGRTKLPRCLPAVSARIYLDGCFLRYDNYSFFNESVDSYRDGVNCSTGLGSITDEDAKVEFADMVSRVVDNVTAIAVSNRGFGTAEVKGGSEREPVYGLAQCWKTLSKDGCRQCLEKAGNAVRGCTPSREGRGLNAGCYLRYSTVKFYNDLGEKQANSNFPRKGFTIAIIVLVATAMSMLSLCGAYVGYLRISKLKEGRNTLGRISSTIDKSNLNFKYETLEKATDYFDPSKKLGQGGSGSVFKGTLPNGETVAVKRLFFHTRQWVDEFFNEVNLISGIKHKNLVKLLGCSIEGPESLLVYEYVPNKSIDQFFFDKKMNQNLSWTQRFEIIVGIAEGLAYLHGGSDIRIIHRDIKSGNVLLDEDLTPKISDFGLARCFGDDKSHLSTGVAGTLGYMAPEYLVRGQLTEKADVYSFGVLVLEIVSGHKNNVFVHDSGSLLQKVWTLFKSNKLVESIDPCLKGDFREDEARNVLQIGLLCTQASVSLRPAMDEVVRMLRDKDCEIPTPKQPPFLNSSVLEPIDSTKTSSLNSTGVHVSYTSTESSTARSSGTTREGAYRTLI